MLKTKKCKKIVLKTFNIINKLFLKKIFTFQLLINYKLNVINDGKVKWCNHKDNISQEQLKCKLFY